jgi:hypothetical protein
MKTVINIDSSDNSFLGWTYGLFFNVRSQKYEREVRLPMQTSATGWVVGTSKKSNGNSGTTEQSRGSGTMSNLHILSTAELQHAIDVIEELSALTDPSDYLRDEATDVSEMLRALDTISTEAYLLINELKES